MKIKSQRDFFAGLAFMVTGIGFAWGASNYTIGDAARMGPGYFPLVLGMLLAFLGGLITFDALAIETEDGEPVGHFAWKPLLLILGAVTVFAFVLPRLGLIISIPILILLSSLASDEFKLREVLILGAILTIGSYLIFITGLKLIFPVWPSFIAG